jgi:DNA end-binding protein Ku
LHSLHYETEILPRNEISSPKSKLTTAELDMAVALVKAMAKPFKPGEYRDEYREALKTIVEAKIKGEKIVAPAATKMDMGDLMASLRASIEAARKEPALKK